MNLFALFVALSFVISSCIVQNDAAYCNGKPDPNAKPNLNPIIDTPLKFVKQVKNGKLYIAGTGAEEIYIVHLWGTPYEMGLAHGTLIKDRVVALLNIFWDYIEEQIIEAINGTTKGFFRKDFLQQVSDFGLDAALDLETLATEKYTGSYLHAQMQGLADSTGLDIKKIRRIHLIGELTKGACSMFGAWGSALPGSDGLLQLRALDWVTDGGLQNFPEITVYHPTAGSNLGHDFINIGWSGWIGSIQGYSSTKMGVSEIGVSYPDDTFGKESRFGTPFTFLLRDILQFDNTLDDTFARITKGHRTCNLILGAGDGKSNRFNSIQYSASVANFMNDTTMKPEADWHPKIKDVVYHGMDWLCPSFNQVLANQLISLHGNITAENAIRNVTSIVQSGSLLTTYYDFPRDTIYTANARGANETGPDNAFDRPFVKINVAALFKEPKPNM